MNLVETTQGYANYPDLLEGRSISQGTQVVFKGSATGPYSEPY